jgi:hypothetical protein
MNQSGSMESEHAKYQHLFIPLSPERKDHVFVVFGKKKDEMQLIWIYSVHDAIKASRL